MTKKETPVVLSQGTHDPQTIEIAFRCLRNSHSIEHRAIGALKRGDTTQAKVELQRQIGVLVSVLALL